MSRGYSNFWELLLDAAYRNGMTGADICKKLGLTRAYIAKGKTTGTVPLLDTAVKLLDACGYRLMAVPKGREYKSGLVINTSDGEAVKHSDKEDM